MFGKIHKKKTLIYYQISKFYTSLIVEHPIVSIICYLLLLVIFGFGLFQLKINQDNQNISFVRNSEIKSEAQRLKEIFPQDQNQRYFPHQLTDLGR